MSQILPPELLKKLTWRRRLVMLLLLLAAAVLLYRAVYLQFTNQRFYLDKGSSRQQRTVEIPANRGMIVDRNGELMAMSAPVDSIYANPVNTLMRQRQLAELAHLTGQDVNKLQQRLSVAEAGKALFLLGNVRAETVRALREIHLPGGILVEETESGYNVSLRRPDTFYTALQQEQQGFAELATVSGYSQQQLRDKLAQAYAEGLRFVYIKRHMPPHEAARIKPYKLAGVGLQREYQRYYPMGEVVAHLLGFTHHIEGNGQEGLELAFDDYLSGQPGAKRVMRNRLGDVIGDLELIRPARPGQDLQLSIDRRVQYLAYRALKSAIQRHQAKSGSVVTLDVQTGEVLALVNQPGFNPNNRKGLRGSQYRNRAITDVFEPGSTIKPITVAAALESGQYQPRTLVNTGKGELRLGENLVKDVRAYGWLDVAGVIKKSSNVGVSKIALSLPPEYHWSVLNHFGFGQSTGSGFPGETSGYMHNYDRWSEFEQATIAFGYGLSVSALQLAQAYAALGNDGQLVPVSFQKGGAGLAPHRVVSAQTAQQVRQMMRAVVSDEGTAPAARVAGYTVAGKTGTVHKNSQRGGYEEKAYVSLFAGMAPALQPRLVTVVMLNEPQGDYFGGKVAAPVFAQVMGGALRLLDVAPDDLSGARILTAAGGVS